MEMTLKITGMHCSSCEKHIKNALSKIPGVQHIQLNYPNEYATIMHVPQLSVQDIIATIQKTGYDAKHMDEASAQARPDERINFTHFIESIQRPERVEGQLLYTAFLTFILITIAEILAYYAFFSDIPDFFSRYGYYLLFLIPGVILIAASVWHIKSYGESFSCMSGMMVGMTHGMIAGFLSGMLIAGTNGLFIGSLAGVILGVATGVYTGKCCGIMGMMEAMMAGFMGGLMGAMTTLMLLNDNLKLIIPFLTLLAFIILSGLDYMTWKETYHTKHNINKVAFLPFLLVCFVITQALTYFMIYGPKTGLFN